MALEHEFIIIPPSQLKEILEPLEMYLSQESVLRSPNGDEMISHKNNSDDIVNCVMQSLLAYYKAKRETAICIRDDCILDNLGEFECVSTVINGIVPFKGLNYYGFTLIPIDSLAVFSSVLRRISRSSEFDSLILLCDMALINKSYILHCGI